MTNQGSAKGRALRSNAGVGIIAPSSPSKADRLAAGVAKLKSFGFAPLIAADPALNYTSYAALFASDTPVVRAAALNSLFASPDIAAILAVRGAYGAMEMLPLVDWNLATKNPKPLIGFSDVTALLIALLERAGIASIHGPSLESSFSKLGAVTPDPKAAEIEQSIDDLLAMLRGQAVQPRIFTKLLAGIKPQVTAPEGMLIGGNLTTVASLMGTPWEPSFDDRIVFFEEVGEQPYRVHRLLLQLKLAGKFRNARGVLLGSFRDCEAQGPGPSLQAVFEDIFAGACFPVLLGGQFGHEALNLAMPIGVLGRIGGVQLEILEEVVIT